MDEKVELLKEINTKRGNTRHNSTSPWTDGTTR